MIHPKILLKIILIDCIMTLSAFSHRGVGLIPYGPEAANSAVNYYKLTSKSL